jgi:hypothetical protein
MMTNHLKTGIQLTPETSYTAKPPAIISEGTAKSKRLKPENDRCREVIYMDDVQGPKKLNDT